MTRQPPLRAALAAGLAAVGLVACSTGDEAGETLPPLPGVTFAPAPSAPASTPVGATPSTSGAPPTAAPLPPTTAGVPATSGPGSTPPTTGPPPSPPPTPPTSAPPSTVAVEPGSLVLRPDGLGVVDFGADPEQAIAALTSALGAPPDVDSGWTDPLSIGGCPGSTARAVAWGSLTAYFSDATDVASGRRHFFTYYYGEPDGGAARPSGLTTAYDLTVGATVADLRRTFADVAIYPPGDSYPATFITASGGLFGVVTGEAPTDRVAVIAGGQGCGR